MKFSWRVPEDQGNKTPEFEVFKNERALFSDLDDGGWAREANACPSFPSFPRSQMLPQRGTILPHGRQRITVSLVSTTVQRYAQHK